MRYGHTVGAAKTARVLGEHSGYQAGRDAKRTPFAYPPELLQAAKKLRIHPAELFRQLNLQRKLQTLVAQYAPKP